MEPRVIRTLVLMSVIVVLGTLALYGAHRTFVAASRQQCAAGGGRWDREAQACVGARVPPAPAR